MQKQKANSGQIANFRKKLEPEKNDVIMTYRAKDEYGRDFFCYIICDYDGHQKMNHDYLDNKSAAPSNYGDVIYADYLVDPDEKARKFLADWMAENGGKISQ